MGMLRAEMGGVALARPVVGARAMMMNLGSSSIAASRTSRVRSEQRSRTKITSRFAQSCAARRRAQSAITASSLWAGMMTDTHGGSSFTAPSSPAATPGTLTSARMTR